MEKKSISRRSFLKLFGAGTVAATATLAGCRKADKAGSQAAEEYKNQVEPPVGQMTYRENPKTKEKVSILGYGMMRLPTKGYVTSVLPRKVGALYWNCVKSTQA